MLEELHTFLPNRVFKAPDGKQYVEISMGYLEEVEPDVFGRCGASTAEAFVLDMVCDAIEDLKWDAKLCHGKDGCKQLLRSYL